MLKQNNTNSTNGTTNNITNNQKKNTSTKINKCQAILKTGKNKGNKCLNNCEGEFCKKHLK